MRTFYRNYNKGLIAEFDKLFQEYYSFESSYLFEYEKKNTNIVGN